MITNDRLAEDELFNHKISFTDETHKKFTSDIEEFRSSLKPSKHEYYAHFSKYINALKIIIFIES